MSMVLYRLEGCPYCEKVVSKLEEENIEFESVWVEGFHSHRNEVKKISGQRQVPVLIDKENNVTISESTPIVGYIDNLA